MGLCFATVCRVCGCCLVVGVFMVVDCFQGDFVRVFGSFSLVELIDSCCGLVFFFCGG